MDLKDINNIGLNSSQNGAENRPNNNLVINTRQNINDGNLEQEIVSDTTSSINAPQLEFQNITNNDNGLVNALMNNDTAISIAKEQYVDLKNQKKIAGKISKVVQEKTNADIESANVKVQDQKKNNKIERQRIKNELFKLKNDKMFLAREQKHKLAMQRKQHILEKYGDLILRYCRKKQKNDKGQYEYLKADGKDVFNVPNRLQLFFMLIFDGIVASLNMTAEIFSGLNKVVWKGGLIILILLLIFIPPFREWLLSLTGINFN